jgi:hypothetical protein
MGVDLKGRKSTFFADFRKLLKSTFGTHIDLEIQNFERKLEKNVDL